MGILKKHIPLREHGKVIQPMANEDNSWLCEKCLEQGKNTPARNFLVESSPDPLKRPYNPWFGYNRLHTGLCGQHAEIEPDLDGIFIWDERGNDVLVWEREGHPWTWPIEL